MKSGKPILLLLCLSLAVFAFQCGGGGSGGGSSSNGGGNGNGNGGNGSGSTVSLVSLSPIVAAQNGAAFTLTVNGSGFTSGNQVTFNGAAEQTTLVSSSRLTAQIPAGALASASSANGFPVTVTGAGNSPTPLGFYVVPAITPSTVSVTAGAAVSGVNIQVASLAPTLQLQSIGGCVCPTETSAGVSTIPATPGQTLNLFIVGNGIVAGTYYTVTGSGVAVTQPVASDFTQTTAPVTPAVNFNITISSGATPGPRNLVVTNPAGEISIYPGAITISSGS